MATLLSTYQFILSFFESCADKFLLEIAPYSNILYSASEAASEGGDHGSHASMAPLLFIILALFIGTATRYWLRNFAIPYTISLLIIGLVLGVANRAGFFSEFLHIGHGSGLFIFSESIDWAGHIDPHLILYIFLPTLIFEAAFAMHVHTFKKSFTNAFILAVPGIIVALLLTGAFVMMLKVFNIGLGMWTWPVALMFGAVISATDPVAVVSILKEVGASKKLGTLIEGESLLNDGTAIVIFMVFFTALTGGEGSNPIVQFLQVSLGGVLIGVTIGWIIVTWLKRVFNDALFEITVVVGAAYLAFFVAEHFFHVSGVLALVAFGIMMAGIGRTRISPQVAHFLHEFWELAAFIANTLIFIIVGVVVAQRVSYTPRDFLILILLYIAITIVRAIVIGMFYPLMKRIGYGITPKDSVIAWWGGLRGAVGLALALIVANEASIEHEVRSQILSLTAGIVVLTSLVNATTIKLLVNKLGLTKVGAVRQQMLSQTVSFLRQSSEKEISKLKENRFMSGADWESVSDYLPDVKDVEVKTEEEEKIFETRKRLLMKEKESYWRQFSEGLLSPAAVQSLSDEIDHLMDLNGRESLGNRKDLENMWKTPKITAKLQKLPLFGGFWKRQFYRKLALSYDCARGFVVANEENLKALSSLIIGTSTGTDVDKEVEALSGLEDEINENKIMGLTFLRNLKDTYPEVYHAIETQIASRSLLNHQMSNIQKMEKQGRLEPSDAANLESQIQSHMKQIIDSPPKYQGTQSYRFLQAIPHFGVMNPNDLEYLASKFKEKVFAIDGKLTVEGGNSDGFMIIVRGTARLEQEGKLKMMLEPGNVIGAYDTLAGVPFWASVTAESPVTTLTLSNSVLAKLQKTKKHIVKHLWYFAGIDLAERLLAKVEPWSGWRAKKLKNFVMKGEIITVLPGEKHRIDAEAIILLVGEVIPENDDTTLVAPCLLTHNEFMVRTSTTLFVLKQDSEKTES
ncbi:MAG TPA: cation:proton antiporter [Tenuifilaceae bacterium]|nr:cation:proton antiporter [Tenuifilaceae bacterium]